MNLYSKKTIRKLESYIIEELGVSSLVLMEHAARSVYDEIIKRFTLQNSEFLILAGTGNNGGDAYTLARILYTNGAKKIYMYELNEPQSPDAMVQKKLLQDSCDEITFVREFTEDFVKDKVIIDGVFGIGFRGELNNEVQELFKLCRHAKYVIAIDVPSGVDVDTGKLSDNSICADLTVSFFLAKKGLYMFPASECTGTVVVKKLFFPVDKLIEAENTFLVDKSLIKKLISQIEPRKYGSNKGNFGKVGVLFASPGYEGASVLVANGAVLAGAGLVSLLTSERTLADIRTSVPNVANDITMTDVSITINYDKFNVIVVGPGMLNNSKITLKRFIDFALEYNKKVVFDAGALDIASKDPELLAKMRQIDSVFTPHPKEMARLLGKDLDFIQSNRLAVAENFVEGSNILLLLKGTGSLIVSKDKQVYVNDCDAPALATAGMGDFLSGLIAGFWAQGMDKLYATILATYLHSFAAKLYEAEYPAFTMTSSSIEQYFKLALQKIIKEGELGKNGTHSTE